MNIKIHNRLRKNIIDLIMYQNYKPKTKIIIHSKMLIIYPKSGKTQ